MSERNPRPDGVNTYPANRHDVESYAQAETALAGMQSPVMLHAGNQHERLYVAALDGTGNSRFKDESENWSAVAKIYDQIERTNPPNIAAGYVEGIYTQKIVGNPLQRVAGSMSRLSVGQSAWKDLDGWLRRRLRCLIWRQAKTRRRRTGLLRKRGLSEERAWRSGHNGQGPWWNAGASHMNAAYPKAYFDACGVLCMADHVRHLQRHS